MQSDGPRKGGAAINKKREAMGVNRSAPAVELYSSIAIRAFGTIPFPAFVIASLFEFRPISRAYVVGDLFNFFHGATICATQSVCNRAVTVFQPFFYGMQTC